MKTPFLICRLCALAMLMGACMPCFGNSWVPVSIDNAAAGESDLPEDSQGAIIKNAFGYPWYGSSTGHLLRGDTAGVVPSADVMVWLDPSTGNGYTGSPLYFTGTYYLMGSGGGLLTVLANIMITVIAPDGSRNVQTLNLWPSYNKSSLWFGYHAYQWTIPITFTAPGTYQVFAAIYTGDPYWYLAGHAGTYGAWYQDINTFSTDGGVTFGHTGRYNPRSNDTSGLVVRNWYGLANTQWSTKIQGDTYLPFTTGNGNQISFTVVNNPGHTNKVQTQAIPLGGLEKWFLPSQKVSKQFQMVGQSNPVPSDGPIYPPNF